MSTLRDLLTGVASLLEANGVGNYLTSQPDPDLPSILMVRMPATPDRAIVLNAISQGDDETMPFGQIMLQVRSRGEKGSPLDAFDIDGAAFDVLQGMTQHQFGAVTVIELARRTNTPIGTDQQTRTEVVSQYYGTLAVPPTVNRPDGGAW